MTWQLTTVTNHYVSSQTAAFNGREVKVVPYTKWSVWKNMASPIYSYLHQDFIGGGMLERRQVGEWPVFFSGRLFHIYHGVAVATSLRITGPNTLFLLRHICTRLPQEINTTIHHCTPLLAGRYLPLLSLSVEKSKKISRYFTLHCIVTFHHRNIARILLESANFAL